MDYREMGDNLLNHNQLKNSGSTNNFMEYVYLIKFLALGLFIFSWLLFMIWNWDLFWLLFCMFVCLKVIRASERRASSISTQTTSSTRSSSRRWASTSARNASYTSRRPTAARIAYIYSCGTRPARSASAASPPPSSATPWASYSCSIWPASWASSTCATGSVNCRRTPTARIPTSYSSATSSTSRTDESSTSTKHASLLTNTGSFCLSLSVYQALEKNQFWVYIFVFVSLDANTSRRVRRRARMWRRR